MLAQARELQRVHLRRHEAVARPALPHRQNAGISRRLLEDRQIAKIDNLADRLLFQPGPQRLAIPRAQPLVGDDDAEEPLALSSFTPRSMK